MQVVIIPFNQLSAILVRLIANQDPIKKGIPVQMYIAEQAFAAYKKSISLNSSPDIILQGDATRSSIILLFRQFQLQASHGVYEVKTFKFDKGSFETSLNSFQSSVRKSGSGQKTEIEYIGVTFGVLSRKINHVLGITINNLFENELQGLVIVMTQDTIKTKKIDDLWKTVNDAIRNQIPEDMEFTGLELEAVLPLWNAQKNESIEETQKSIKADQDSIKADQETMKLTIDRIAQDQVEIKKDQAEIKKLLETIIQSLGKKE
jgi:hypothetical protein